MLLTLVRAADGVWPGPANVMAAAPLVASFNSTSPQCYCTSIGFNDTTTGGEPPYIYSWDFGDGSGTSTDQNPTYHYGAVGSYNVTLQVTDSASNSDTHWEEVLVISDADLGIAKDDSPDPVFAGQTLTYNITVSNGGPCDAVAVVVTDALPSILSNPEYSTDDGATWLSYNGTVDLGTIANGDMEQFMIRAAVGCPAICPQVFANTATVDSPTSDPAPANNSASTTTTVSDNTPPVIISSPSNVTVECSGDVPPPDVGNVTATDNCGNVNITHVGDADDGNTCPKTITRTYRVTDVCGNSVDVIQTITVNDTVAPVITCPADMTIECDESTDPSNTGNATATDNCDTDVEVTYSDISDGGTCYGNITRTWTATDDCGNTDECVQTITVVDSTPPMITSSPGNVTVECSGDIPPHDIGNVTATDNCGNVTVIHLGDADDGNTCPRTITRTYQAADDCGNSANVTQTITVDDTIAPVITCAANVTVEYYESTDPSNTGNATATDNCDADVDITYSDQTTGGFSHEMTKRSWTDTETGGDYVEIIERTWTATDDCGNSAQCVQMIGRLEVGATPIPVTVGGTILPTDKPGLVMPWLIAAVAFIVLAGVSLVVLSRRQGAQRGSP